MKKISIILIAALFGVSCFRKKAVDFSRTDLKNEKEEATSQPTLPFLLSELDTIIVKDYTLRLTQISKSDFQKNKLINPDSSESKNILSDSARVKRIGRKLVFNIPSTQKQVILEDTSPEQETEAEDALVRYKYLDNLKDISQWLVYYALWEGSGYLLIDQRTGNKRTVYGIPAVSPDKKLFICGSADLVAGYNPNGLQLFKINNSNIELEWERALTKWGPEKLIWETKNSFLAEQIMMDSDHNEQTKYIRLTLKKN